MNSMMNAIKEFFSDLISDWPGWIVIGIVVLPTVYFLSGPVMGYYKFHSKEALSFQEIVSICQVQDVPDSILTKFAEVKLVGVESFPKGYRDFFSDFVVGDDFVKAEKFSNKYDPPFIESRTLTVTTANKSKELAEAAKAAIDQSEEYTFRPERWGVTYEVMVTPGHRYIKVEKFRSTSGGWGVTDTWYIRWSKMVKN